MVSRMGCEVPPNQQEVGMQCRIRGGTKILQAQRLALTLTADPGSGSYRVIGIGVVGDRGRGGTNSQY